MLSPRVLATLGIAKPVTSLTQTLQGMPLSSATYVNTRIQDKDKPVDGEMDVLHNEISSVGFPSVRTYLDSLPGGSALRTLRDSSPMAVFLSIRFIS